MVCLLCVGVCFVVLLCVLFCVGLLVAFDLLDLLGCLCVGACVVFVALCGGV